MLFPLLAGAQVAINEHGTEPNAHAMLDVQGQKKGILIPRMSAADRDDISDAPTGLVVFVTDDNQFYYYDGSQWLPFGKNDGDWKVDGNKMYAIPRGNIGIGTTRPNEKFTLARIGAIRGTTNADNGGMVIEDRDVNDRGEKLFIDANELQATQEGEANNFHINRYGGGLYINHDKFYFDNKDNLNKGILYGGVGNNKQTLLRYYADPNETGGNMAVLSGSGLSVVAGGGEGYRALANYIYANDPSLFNQESVYLIADEPDSSKAAIEMDVHLQGKTWENRIIAMRIYGDGMVQIPTNLDAGADSRDGRASFVIGDTLKVHLEMDNNEIHAMDGTDAAKLMINYNGGHVQMFSGDNPGQLNLNGAGFSYALNLPNDDKDSIGVARARAWDTYSDARLKTQVRVIPNPLRIIKRLKPRYYFQHNSEFISKGENYDKMKGIKILDSGEYGYGFLAQELYHVVPQAVHKPKNEQTDLWSVNYTELIPILTAAIQQQQKQIEALKEEIQRLRQQIRQ